MAVAAAAFVLVLVVVALTVRPLLLPARTSDQGGQAAAPADVEVAVAERRAAMARQLDAPRPAASVTGDAAPTGDPRGERGDGRPASPPRVGGEEGPR